MKVLKFLIPNGSLAQRLLMYLALAGYGVDKPDRRGYCGRSQDGRIEFIERDRRMIPHLVAGSYDAGITGLDLVLNSGVKGLRTIAKLCFAKHSDRPTRWVIAADPEEMEQRKKFVPYTRKLGCELPGLVQHLRDSGKLSGGFDKEIVLLAGNEEMAIQDRLCHAILVVTETGNSLRDAGLVILPGCDKLLVSMPQIIAKPELPSDKEEALQEIRFALEAVIGGASRVMVKADLPTKVVHGLGLPAEVSPTVSSLDLEGWSAVEVCIPRSDIGPVGLKLERAGARGIVVQEVIAYCSGKKPTPSPEVTPPSRPIGGSTDTIGYRH